MNEFNLLAQRDGWIIVNHFVEIRQNPKRLLIYLLYIFWMGTLVFNSVIRYRHVSDMQLQSGPEILGAVFAGLGTAFILFFLYRGTKESSTFFSMGDVHFLFPAPVSPKKVLLYSMVKQSLINFLLYGIFILAFMPMIIDIVSVKLEYLPFMYLGYIGLVLVIGPLKFLVFAIGSKYSIQPRLQRGLLALMAVFILYLLASIISAGNLMQALLEGLNASFINYLPVIGWSKVAFMTAVTGYSTYSMVALILQFVFLLGCIVISYYIADDYYEDTLKATEQRSLRKKRKEGAEKPQRSPFLFGKRKNLIVKKVGTGPWALFWRSKLEYSRSDFHPYLGLLTILFLLVGIAAGIFTGKQADGLTSIYMTNGIIAYIIFIFSASTAGQHELTKPYVFLIPGSNLLKIVSTNLLDILRMSVNSLALNIPLGILLEVPIHIIVIMVIFMVSFYTLNLSSNYLIRIIFPNALDQKALYPLFLMLQILLLLLPGLIVGGALALIYQNPLLAFAGISLVNIIIIGVLLLLSNAVFARLEWR